MQILKRTIFIIVIIIANTFIITSSAFANITELSLPDVDNSFKTYMSYTAITNKESKQWVLQQGAATADNGIRVYEDRYMIAVGSYYADSCGDKLNIYLDNGHIIYCVIGDFKQDVHTDKTNRYVPWNGNIVEFIVDTDEISRASRKMGDMSYSENLDGEIIKIEVEQ